MWQKTLLLSSLTLVMFTTWIYVCRLQLLHSITSLGHSVDDFKFDFDVILNFARYYSRSCSHCFRRKFVIYNSSPQDREEVVRIWVTTVPVSVYDSSSHPAVCQVSPYLTDQLTISDSTYKVNTCKFSCCFSYAIFSWIILLM